jgi:hypothetical protein
LGLVDCNRSRKDESKIVILVVLFNSKGIFHHEFVPRGQTVNKTAVPGSFIAFEGFFEQEKARIVGKPDSDVAP